MKALSANNQRFPDKPFPSSLPLMWKVLKVVILLWVIGTVFSYWIIRGNGMVFFGNFLILQTKMINASEKALIRQIESNSLPLWAAKRGRKILKASTRILERESEMYERLQVQVKRAQDFFTASYIF